MRNVIERAFGLLVCRWRILRQELYMLDPEQMLATIYACCILHNLCLNRRHDLDDNIYHEQDQPTVFTSDPCRGEDFQAIAGATAAELRRRGQQRHQELVQYIWPTYHG